MRNSSTRGRAQNTPPIKLRNPGIFATSTTLAGLLIMVYTLISVTYLIYTIKLSWMCKDERCDGGNKIIETYSNQSAVGSMMTISSLIVSTSSFVNFCFNMIRMPHTLLDWMFHTISNIVYSLFIVYILNYCDQFPENTPQPQCNLLFFQGFNNTHVLSICNWHRTLSFVLIHFTIYAYSRNNPLYIGIRKLTSEKMPKRNDPLIGV